MTKAAAIRLVTEAFGAAGVVVRFKSAKPAGRFVVGLRTDKGLGVLGRGRSWVDAFSDAERRIAAKVGE